MNLKRQLGIAFIGSLGFAVMFGFLALLVSRHRILTFDNKVTRLVQDARTPFLTGIMKLFTWIGSGMTVAILAVTVMIVLATVFHHRSELVLFLIVIAGSALLNQILKSLFHRARPSLNRLIEAGGFSFPSGHSMEAASFYGILAFLLWRHISGRAGRVFLIACAAGMILAIGVSRVYLGVHYPSDILGGYFASGFWLAAAIWVYQRYKEQRFESGSESSPR